MNLRTIVAAIVGAIVFFLLGFLFFGYLLEDFFQSRMIDSTRNLMLKEPRIIFIFLWHLVWCWLVAFIFDYWATIRTFAAGAKGGAIIMFSIALGIDLSNYAFMNQYTDGPWIPIIVHVLVVTVMGAIVGGVIGFVLGKMNKD